MSEVTQEMILDYLIKKGGVVKNVDLVRHFRKYLQIESPQEKDRARVVFKERVNKVASIKADKKEKYLHLRPEFIPPGGLSRPPSGRPLGLISDYPPPLDNGGTGQRPPPLDISTSSEIKSPDSVLSERNSVFNSYSPMASPPPIKTTIQSSNHVPSPPPQAPPPQAPPPSNPPTKVKGIGEDDFGSSLMAELSSFGSLFDSFGVGGSTGPATSTMVTSNVPSSTPLGGGSGSISSRSSVTSNNVSPSSTLSSGKLTNSNTQRNSNPQTSAYSAYSNPQTSAYSAYSNPQTSAYSAYSNPQTSAYSAYSNPQTSAYSAPQKSAYSSPQTSAYSNPQTSAYSAPQTSAYSSPQTSAYSTPQTSANSTPLATSYSANSTPKRTVNSTPLVTSYSANSTPQKTPPYSANSTPQKTSNKKPTRGQSDLDFDLTSVLSSLPSANNPTNSGNKTNKAGQNSSRFDQPKTSQSSFQNSTKFNQPKTGQTSFQNSTRFDQPKTGQSSFQNSTRFDQPKTGQSSFQNSTRFDQPQPSFQNSTKFDQPKTGQTSFQNSTRFDQPKTSPSSFQNSTRFDQPERGSGYNSIQSPPISSPPVPPQEGGERRRRAPQAPTRTSSISRVSVSSQESDNTRPLLNGAHPTTSSQLPGSRLPSQQSHARSSLGSIPIEDYTKKIGSHRYIGAPNKAEEEENPPAPPPSSNLGSMDMGDFASSLFSTTGGSSLIGHTPSGSSLAGRNPSSGSSLTGNASSGYPSTGSGRTSGYPSTGSSLLGHTSTDYPSTGSSLIGNTSSGSSLSGRTSTGSSMTAHASTGSGRSAPNSSLTNHAPGPTDHTSTGSNISMNGRKSSGLGQSGHASSGSSLAGSDVGLMNSAHPSNSAIPSRSSLSISSKNSEDSRSDNNPPSERPEEAGKTTPPYSRKLGPSVSVPVSGRGAQGLVDRSQVERRQFSADNTSRRQVSIDSTPDAPTIRVESPTNDSTGSPRGSPRRGRSPSDVSLSRGRNTSNAGSMGSLSGVSLRAKDGKGGSRSSIFAHRRSSKNMDKNASLDNFTRLSISMTPPSSRKHRPAPEVAPKPHRAPSPSRSNDFLAPGDEDAHSEYDNEMDNDNDYDEIDPLERDWMLAGAQADIDGLQRLMMTDSTLLDRKGFLHGYTALHWAAKHGRIDILTMLLLQGARADLKSNGGLTPLHLASQAGHDNILEVLITQHNANINIRENGGRRAIDVLNHKASDYSRVLLSSQLDNHGLPVRVENARLPSTFSRPRDPRASLERNWSSQGDLLHTAALEKEKGAGNKKMQPRSTIKKTFSFRYRNNKIQKEPGVTGSPRRERRPTNKKDVRHSDSVFL